MRQTIPHDEWINSFNNPKVEVLGKYRGRRHPIEVMCKKCGKVWTPMAMQVSRGQGCSDCQYAEKRKKYRIPLEEFDKRVLDVHKGKIKRASSDSDYTGVNGKIVYRCLVCGSTWETTGSRVVNYPFCGCPKCAKSKYEEKVAEYLDSLGIEYVQGACLADCKSAGGGKSFFDFVLPGIGVIEVDGEQHFGLGKEYWFTHESLERIVVSDELKTKYCEEHQIPLLRIRYSQIRRNKKYVSELDDFLNHSEEYVVRHNREFPTEEEYYQERKEKLMNTEVDIFELKERILSCPSKRRSIIIYKDLVGNEYTSLPTLCKENHISYRNVKKKRDNGMSLEEILLEHSKKQYINLS